MNVCVKMLQKANIFLLLCNVILYIMNVCVKMFQKANIFLLLLQCNFIYDKCLCEDVSKRALSVRQRARLFSA